MGIVGQPQKPESEMTQEEIREENRILIEYLLNEVETYLANHDITNELIEELRDEFDRNGRLSEDEAQRLRNFYDGIGNAIANNRAR